MSLTAAQVDKLLEPLHPSRVKKAQGQSHIESWDVRRYLLRIFGWGGWDFEVQSCDLVHERTEPQTNRDTGEIITGKYRTTVVYRVVGRLTIRDPEGNRLAVFEDGATGDAVNQPSIGDAHDMALKTAMSQALKRCAANLGDPFGLALYRDGNAEPAVVLRTVGAGAPIEDVTSGPLEGSVPIGPPARGGVADYIAEDAAQ